MELVEKNPKKICSFYVSKWHFVTMLLPYLNQKLEDGENVITILEENVKQNIHTLLSRINLNKINKEKIETINWNKDSLCNKYIELEKSINENLDIGTKLNIIISGKKEYINTINSNIDNWIRKNRLTLVKIKITIINCYEVMQFNDNITEVLNQHDKILNTSGEMEIESVFDGYNKKDEVV